MKKKELVGLEKAELEKRLTELNSELIKLNAQVSTGTPPKSPGQVRNVKKSIARILTILKQKDNEKTVSKPKTVGGTSTNG